MADARTSTALAPGYIKGGVTFCAYVCTCSSQNRRLQALGTVRFLLPAALAAVCTRWYASQLRFPSWQFCLVRVCLVCGCGGRPMHVHTCVAVRRLDFCLAPRELLECEEILKNRTSRRRRRLPADPTILLLTGLIDWPVDCCGHQASTGWLRRWSRWTSWLRRHQRLKTVYA